MDIVMMAALVVMADASASAALEPKDEETNCNVTATLTPLSPVTKIYLPKFPASILSPSDLDSFQAPSVATMTDISHDSTRKEMCRTTEFVNSQPNYLYALQTTYKRLMYYV